jgi:hypothetical protein
MRVANSARKLEHRFGAFEGATAKEAEIIPGLRQVVYCLSSLTALLFLSVGIFCFRATSTPRPTDADQVCLAAENVPSQSAISIANAIQALSIRH